MIYQFQFTRKAEQEFIGIEKTIQKQILKKLEYFEKAEDPLKFAKRLTGTDHYFRFRVGDYRIIVTPKDEKTIVILVILKIGNRKEVYDDVS